MRIAALALVVGAAAFAVSLGIGWPARAYLDSDWMQYYAGSHAVLEGASPYDLPWWRAFHEERGSIVPSSPPHTGDPATDWTTPYPLWTFVLLLPFAFFPVGVAAPLFAIVQAAAVLAAAGALASAWLPRRAVPLAVVLVAASQPLWALIVGGNAAGFAAAAFTFALVAVVAGRPLAGGVALAVCLVKPHVFILGALALVLGAKAEGRPRVLAGAAIGSAAIVVPTFLLRPAWVPAWLESAGRLQATSFSNATGWTIARPFAGDYVPLSAAVVGACVLAVTVWSWRARPGLGRLVAAALPASVLVAPHGWSYDYLALVPTALHGLRAAYAAGWRTGTLLAVTGLVVVAPWALYVVAFARNGEDLSAWLLVAAAGLVMVAGPRRDR